MDLDPLENPAENPCFGCGPGHERGLHLEMGEGRDDQGRFVGCRYTPAEDEIGWPGFLHGGLHFTLLYEVSYWTALTLGPGLMVPRGAFTFEQPTTPRVGRTVEARGRLIEQQDRGEQVPSFRVVARSRSPGGRLLGRLEGTWAPTGRERLEAADVQLPGYLWDDVAGGPS